jgi:DNA-binding MarR family transcriptional regulator
MTQLVSRLERDGYAKRRPDPADARVVVVHLTKGGARLVRERREARARLLGSLLATLPPADRAAIAAALPALARLSSL